jgi:hypothetical protein
MIEPPDQVKGQVAVQAAGLLGALKVYEVFAFPDGLIKRRDAGTLAGSMPDAVVEGCK